MRIGILGGTFNPVHLGHMILAKAALGQLKLDKLYFIPANIAPLKSRRALISARHRLNMLRLSVKGKKKFFVSDIEIKRGGVSYTIDTLRAFKKKDAKIFFISGSDSSTQLDRWKDFDEIQRIATFVVALRPGFILDKGRRRISFIKMPQIGISSSDLRLRIRQGRPFEHLIDELVLKYIKQNKLYQ